MGCSITRAPPRDVAGCVTPHDHEQIYPADIMLRGIPVHWIKETESGERRISSGAFQASSDKYKGMSLGAKKVLECYEKSVEEWARDRFGAVVCLPVGKLKNAGMQVGWDPTADDPSHCNAWGNLGKSLQKCFAKSASRRFLDP